MKEYKLEHTHSITDVYYVSANSEKEVEDLFLEDKLDAPDESWEAEDLGEYTIEQVRGNEHREC